MKGSLYLTESNVIDYTDFYLSNIIGEDGDIFMLRNLDDVPFMDSLGRDQQMELEKKHTLPEVIKDTTTGNLNVIADLFYGGTLLKAKIIVDNNGKIEILPNEMIMSTTIGFNKQ